MRTVPIQCSPPLPQNLGRVDLMHKLGWFPKIRWLLGHVTVPGWTLPMTFSGLVIGYNFCRNNDRVGKDPMKNISEPGKFPSVNAFTSEPKRFTIHGSPSLAEPLGIRCC